MACIDGGVAVPTPEGSAGIAAADIAGRLLLRGIGPMVTKSLALLSVSMQPLPLRTAAVRLSRAATGVVSEQVGGRPAVADQVGDAAPDRASAGEQRCVVHQRDFARGGAHVDGAREASAAGSAVVPPAPCASWIR